MEDSDRNYEEIEHLLAVPAPAVKVMEWMLPGGAVLVEKPASPAPEEKAKDASATLNEEAESIKEQAG